jgi:hypothetical protein
MYHHLHFSTPALAQRFINQAQFNTDVITASQVVDGSIVLLTSNHRLIEQVQEVTQSCRSPLNSRKHAKYENKLEIRIEVINVKNLNLYKKANAVTCQ